MENNLTAIIDERIKELKITSLDISFNELADMYKNDELIITPNYQRTFRWDISRQSRFVESLLLEMPIPPIYAIEIEDGRYELIDGLQRISSYLNYRGLLKELPVEPKMASDVLIEDVDENDEVLEDEEDTAADVERGFALSGCDIIPELNGKRFDDLPASMKIKAKRSFVRMDVLRKGINPQLKYHMFKRLNTGGEKLSYQELRNCSIRLIDNKFIDFINDLASNADFLQTLAYVSKNQKKKKFAEELVLRFFALKNKFSSFSHNVDSFLTEYMEEISMGDTLHEPKFNYFKEKEVFENTFRILNNSLGKEAFAVYKNNSQKLSGFNVYQYEAITTGMQSIYEELVNGSYPISKFTEKIKEAKMDKTFKLYTVGGGKNSSGVLMNRYQFIVNKLGE
ncbi:DUF262 domain-containing protein [Phosphitispora fastidiosa]|uniref:DUF262 domain-containing protein n=1 Tax=Phosphitispora fastidiosa TaxID=2837202 RepID=UPI001E6485B4|nr:DUF262 domain-containing protein [Phosphitispora fastidiosa]MBU7008722.1 hypothetical protein [Phosphitispora fastidiosa]